MPFEFEDYREFLLSRTGPKSERRGVKSQLAQAMGCQPTFISQVLSGKLDLNLEQAEKISRFFGLASEEKAYFLLLVQKARAGTRELKSFFENQISEMQDRRLVLTKRLGQTNTLSEEDRSRYYSSWIYAAVHIALTIEGLRSAEVVAQYLGVHLKVVQEALSFLFSAHLIEKKGDSYSVRENHVRLGNDSHLIRKHHTNWRMRAIQALDFEEPLDLHYSSAFSISKKDLKRTKELLLETLKSFAAVVKDSKEEELCSLNIDLFSLKSMR